MTEEYIKKIFNDTNLSELEIDETIKVLGFSTRTEFIKEVIRTKPENSGLEDYILLFNVLLKRTVVA